MTEDHRDRIHRIRDRSGNLRAFIIELADTGIASVEAMKTCDDCDNFLHAVEQGFLPPEAE